ncbi:MAG: phosphatidylglycerophosphatase A [Pseudomonadota bacterium]
MRGINSERLGQPRREKFRAFAVNFLASGAFLGYIPVAPGTFGTLAGIPLYLALSWLHPVAGVLGTLAVAGLAVPIAGAAERLLGFKDPGFIVIDEIAGFLTAMLLIAPSVGTVAVGFALFRVFDILKPPPVRRMESLGGGLGIVADDIAAGIYANIILRLVFFR